MNEWEKKLSKTMKFIAYYKCKTSRQNILMDCVECCLFVQIIESLWENNVIDVFIIYEARSRYFTLQYIINKLYLFSR